MTVHQDKITTELFQKHRGELEQFARRIVGCPVKAEDIVQEAFLKFAKGVQAADLDKPISYLSRIVRNLSIDVLRRSKREGRIFDAHVTSQEIDSLADRDGGPESNILHLNEYQRMLEALDELPERTRLAVIMHMVDGYKLRKIAEELDISLGQAHRLVKIGTTHCRHKLLALRS